MASGWAGSGVLTAPPPPPTLLPELPTRAQRWAAVEFLALVAYQAFHQVEHALETAQKRLGAEHVHSLLGGVDFEWLHLGANSILFFGLVGVTFGYGRHGRAYWRERYRPFRYVVGAALVVEGYHVVEHIVRAVQYVGGASEPGGIATQVLDPVWFHFAINLVVLVTMAVAFVGLRVHRDLAGKDRSLLGPG